MNHIVVLRHVAFEDLGVLADLFHQRGDDVFYVDAPVADLTNQRLFDADLMVVLGAPIGVYEEDSYPFLRAEKACIKQRLDAGKAVLGICLGAQLIADVLGGTVTPGIKEIGYAPVILTEEGQQSVLQHLDNLPVLHWHGDTMTLPAGAISLAHTESCQQQAFALGKHILALQFHLEADPQTIEYWLVGHACELAAAQSDITTIRADAQQVGPALREAAIKTIGQWLQQALA